MNNEAFSCFLWVPTVLCSGRYNSIYLIITYFISIESKFSVLQDSTFTKSRSEHPFSLSGHLLRIEHGGLGVKRDALFKEL